MGRTMLNEFDTLRHDMHNLVMEIEHQFARFFRFRLNKEDYEDATKLVEKIMRRNGLYNSQLGIYDDNHK